MSFRPFLRTLLAAATLAFLAAAAPAAAQSATATFQVSASVAKNCTIAATPVAFGAYDPVAANDTADATATGTVTVRCTRGTAYSVALENGANFSAGRRMQLGATGQYLSYELYSDAARTAVWNASAPAAGTAPSRAAIPLTVYGRVPGGQDVPEGAYLDTVVATINF
jgi:spore coat protein U-like protein